MSLSVGVIAWLAAAAIAEGGEEISFSQCQQDLTLTPLWPRNYTGFFVESGAYDGVTGSNTLLFERRGWNGLLVEPSADNFALILANASRKARAFHGILSASKDQKNVSFPCGKSQTGSVHTKAVTQPLSLCNVESKTLTELLLSAAGFGQRVVDFWSLDVEGAEPGVLDVFDQDAIEVGVLLIEANKGDRNTRSIRMAMEGKGFREVGRTYYIRAGLCAGHPTQKKRTHPLKTQDLIFINPKYFAARGWKVPAKVQDVQLEN